MFIIKKSTITLLKIKEIKLSYIYLVKNSILFKFYTFYKIYKIYNLIYDDHNLHNYK
jgi:hypothetical protein